MVYFGGRNALSYTPDVKGKANKRACFSFILLCVDDELIWIHYNF